MLNTALSDYLMQLKQLGLYRQRASKDPACQVNFSSNDYLSLIEEPLLKKAFQRGFARCPTGSGGSMVICGYHPVHRELEQAFAQALGVDDALLFSSGYAANLGIVSLLAHFNAHLFIDKAAHASFYDGIKLTKIGYTRYIHHDLAQLAMKLASFHDKNAPVIVTESVFSMSGQASNLKKINQLAITFGASCIIDEAHAFGVLGPQGLGAVEQYQLSQQEIPLRVIPFGKSFAVQGAIVAGRREWIDALLQLSRSFIYSTALSPALAYGILETLSFIRQAEDRRQKIYQLIHYFQTLSEQSSLQWRCSNTPIQQLQLGCPHKALVIATYLREKGIFCQAMREPTVNKKETGLRVILNYHHEFEQIDLFFSLLEQGASLIT